MKEINRIKNVSFLGLLDGNPVLRYKEHIAINDFNIEVSPNDDFCIMNNLIQGTKNGKDAVFIDGCFKEFPPIRFEERIMWTLKDSMCYDGDTFKLSYYVNGEEHLFETKTKDKIAVCKCPANKNEDVLAFSSGFEKKYLFYSKTGEFLWQYTEDADDLKINWRCIPVVDDVVVVISMRGLRPEKIQGFNIHTGERLWGITFEGKGVSNTLFVGEDKILYGCMRPFASNGLVLTSLNPFTGELIKHVISEEDGFEVMPWLVTMHGRQLYYTDNRRGNEIGVIDVDKRELIERVPLNIKKKVTIGAPVVTDDKVYVFIDDLQELRVFEK